MYEKNSAKRLTIDRDLAARTEFKKILNYVNYKKLGHCQVGNWNILLYGNNGLENINDVKRMTSYFEFINIVGDYDTIFSVDWNKVMIQKRLCSI